MRANLLVRHVLSSDLAIFRKVFGFRNAQVCYIGWHDEKFDTLREPLLFMSCLRSICFPLYSHTFITALQPPRHVRWGNSLSAVEESPSAPQHKVTCEANRVACRQVPVEPGRSYASKITSHQSGCMMHCASKPGQV